MKISVAMCTYDGATYLEEQLASIAAQTRLPNELVVCDDQSSDDTRKIVEAFVCESRFPVHLYINEQNLGSTKSFERAIALCEGDIIALSDQDDVWHPKKLMRMETAFSLAPHAGVVFTDAEVVDESLRPMGYSLWEHLSFDQTEQDLIKEGKALDLLSKRAIVTGATMAFRSEFKDLVLPIPSFTGPVIHDGWIALMIAAVADLVLIHEPLMKYRQHPKQQVGAGPTSVNLAKTIKANERLAISLLTNVRAGLARINFFERLDTVLKLGLKTWFDLNMEPLVAVYNRLSAHSSSPRYQNIISDLEARIAHIRVRASMPKRRLSRIPVVLRELLTLRYHRYSYGIRSAVIDFAR